MSVGALHERVAFDRPEPQPDGQGGVIDGWCEMFCRWANYRYLRGGETVQAARLEGRQPVVITVRKDGETKQVTTDWRVRDARDGTVFNIRAIMPGDRGYLEITAESGVAV